MIAEHMHKLRDMAEEYNTPIYQLMETYSKKQTDYLRRDLKNKRPIKDFLSAHVYGYRAMNVMENYLKRKNK